MGMALLPARAEAPPRSLTVSNQTAGLSKHIKQMKEKKWQPVTTTTRPTTTTYVPRPSQSVTTSPPPRLSISDQEAKMFIYMHESGNNPAARNAAGCRGLGQACPGSKLPCSDSDYACQDAWFTNYCMSRYGSWQNAYAFWLSHNWW